MKICARSRMGACGVSAGLAAEGAADGGSPLSPPGTAVTPFTRTMSEVAASYARGLSEAQSPTAAGASADRQAAGQPGGPPAQQLPHGGSDGESWHSAMDEDTGADAARGVCQIVRPDCFCGFCATCLETSDSL